MRNKSTQDKKSQRRRYLPGSEWPELGDFPLDKTVIHDRAKEWINSLHQASALDCAQIERTISAFYKRLGLRTPQIVYLASPFQIAVAPWLYKQITGQDLGKEQELGRPIQQSLLGRIGRQLNSPWTGRTISNGWWIAMEYQLDNLGLGALMHHQYELGQKLAEWLYDQFRESSRSARYRPREDEEDPRKCKRMHKIWKELATHPLWQELARSNDFPLDRSFWSRSLKNFKMADESLIWHGCNLLWNDVYLLGFFDVLQELPSYKFDLKISEEWSDWKKLANAVGGILLFQDICFVSEKPRRIFVEHHKQLHNDVGPALDWGDGFQLFAHHGQILNWQQADLIFAPENISVDDIDTEDDEDVRSILIQKYGEQRFLSEIGAIEIHRDDYGVLYSRTSASKATRLLVKVFAPEGSETDYFMSLDEKVNTARAAVAKMFWLKPKHYKPAARSMLTSIEENMVTKNGKSANKSKSVNKTKSTGKSASESKIKHTRMNKRKTKTKEQWPGLSWRVLVRDWKRPREPIHDIEGDGTSWFDELVVGDWFHLEWMHGRTWWMRVGDASIYVTAPKGGKPPVLKIERGIYHEKPTAKQDKATLAEVDPHDDAFGPEEC